MALSPWFTLAEYLIAFIGQTFGFYVFGSILLHRWFQKPVPSVAITPVTTSPCIIFYFYTQTIATGINITFLIYYFIHWRPYPVEFNALIIFYLGTLQLFAITLTPLSVFALGLDRSLCVGFPMKYSKGQNLYPKYLAIGIMFGITAFSLISFIIPTYPVDIITHCSTIGCMASKGAIETFFYMRCFTSALLLVNSLVLVIVMRGKLSFNQVKNKKVNLFTARDWTGESLKFGIVVFASRKRFS